MHGLRQIESGIFIFVFEMLNTSVAGEGRDFKDFV